MPVNSTFVAAALDRSVCRKCSTQRHKCQCRRCSACQSNADSCYCPYPSKQFPWGRAQYDADLDGLEAMGQANSKLFAADVITGFEFTKANRHIEAMERKCRGKLFAIAKRMQDKDADYKAAGKGAAAMTVLHPSINNFGATLSTSEIARLQAIDKKGW